MPGSRSMKIPSNRFHIAVTVFGEPGPAGVGGALQSNLAELVGTADWTCDDRWRGAIEALESLILAQACAGIDIATAAYARALETTLESLCNHWD